MARYLRPLEFAPELPRTPAPAPSKDMKDKIHPGYKDCTVTCGCGNSFTTKATVKELKIEICNVCHPFYSGKQKFVDAAGRVDRFRKKYAHLSAATSAPAPAEEPAPVVEEAVEAAPAEEAVEAAPAEEAAEAAPAEEAAEEPAPEEADA